MPLLEQVFAHVDRRRFRTLNVRDGVIVDCVTPRVRVVYHLCGQSVAVELQHRAISSFWENRSIGGMALASQPRCVV